MKPSVNYLSSNYRRIRHKTVLSFIWMKVALNQAIIDPMLMPQEVKNALIDTTGNLKTEVTQSNKKLVKIT